MIIKTSLDKNCTGYEHAQKNVQYIHGPGVLEPRTQKPPPRLSNPVRMGHGALRVAFLVEKQAAPPKRVYFLRSCVDEVGK